MTSQFRFFVKVKPAFFLHQSLRNISNFDPVYRIYEKRSAATAERVVWRAPLVGAAVVAAGVVVSGIGTQHATER